MNFYTILAFHFKIRLRIRRARLIRFQKGWAQIQRLPLNLEIIFSNFIFFFIISSIIFTARLNYLSVKISTTTLIIYWAKLIYFQSKLSYFFTLFIQRILSSFKPHVRLLSTKHLNNKCMLCIAL